MFSAATLKGKPVRWAPTIMPLGSQWNPSSFLRLLLKSCSQFSHIKVSLVDHVNAHTVHSCWFCFSGTYAPPHSGDCGAAAADGEQDCDYHGQRPQPYRESFQTFQCPDFQAIPYSSVYSVCFTLCTVNSLGTVFQGKSCCYWCCCTCFGAQGFSLLSWICVFALSDSILQYSLPNYWEHTWK